MRKNGERKCVQKSSLFFGQVSKSLRSKEEVGEAEFMFQGTVIVLMRSLCKQRG